MKEENRAQEQMADELVAMRQQIADLETLQRTSLQLTSSLDLSTVLGSIAKSVLALVGASDCIIYLCDETGENFSFGTALGRWAETGEVRAPRPSGLTATVVREGRPVVIDDAVHHPLYASPEAREWNVQAIAGFPLRWAGRLLGVLHVVFVEPHSFRQEELRVLGLLADQAAIAIENSQLYARARQEIAERKQAEDELRRLQDLHEDIVQNMAEGIFVLDADGCFTFVNPASAALLGHEIDDLVGHHWTAFVPPDQQPLVHAADQRRARGQTDRYELQLLRKDGKRVPTQVSGSPRIDPSTGETLGTMGVFTDITERVRVEEELRKHRDHLEDLVNERTAALTEANAQLQREIDERERAEAEREDMVVALGAQAVRQDALLRLSAELAATLDEDEVCLRVAHGLRDTLGYDFVAVFLMDGATGDRVLAASVGFDEPPLRLAPGRGLSERAVLDGRLHYSPDVTLEPGYFYGMGGSEVDVPIPFGGQVLGVLVAESKRRDAFDQDDFEVLTAAAQQAGLALEKARLLAAERQRADELDALRMTMADVTAELELPVLLQAIVERAAGLIDATGGELGLYEEASQEIQVVVSHNMGEAYVGTCHKLGEGAMGRVAQSGESLIVEDYRTWEQRAPQYADTDMHAVLATPLKVSNRLVGAITLATSDPGRQFGPAELHLLNLFAQQAAIAIENARLFDQTQRRAAQAALVFEVGRRVSGELELDALLSEIVNVVHEAFDYYGVMLALVDEDAECLRLQATAGGYVGRIPEDLQIPLGEGMTGHAAATGAAQISGDVAQNPHYLHVAEEETRSELAVPIKSGHKVIGVLDLESKEFDAFDATDLMLMETLADQIAVAIENARLYADLRASQEYGRSIIDGSMDPIIAVDRERRIVEFNRAAQETFGYRPEEVLGQHVDMLYADSHEGEQVHRASIEKGRWTQEVLNRRKNGELFPGILSASVLYDAQGELVGVMGISRDITERKQFEEEIRRQKDYFEALFVNSPIAIVTADLDAKVVSWNPMAERLFGYTQAEAIGRHADDLVANHDSIRAEATSYTDQLFELGRVQVTTKRGRKDGSLVDVEVLALPLVLAGEKAGFYAMYHDISERKQMERELRRQKEYYEALFVNSPVAVVTVDPDGNVVSWNPAAEGLFGYSQAEAIGRNVDELVANDDSIREEAARYTQLIQDGYESATEAFPDLLDDLGRFQVSTRRTRRDGSLVDVALSGLPVIVAGEEVGVIAIYSDISELQNARREAEAANQAKSIFLANMSHELRTPLNAILGFSQLMDGDPNLSAEQQENLAIINRSGEHLLALINDVLEMSKIEAGQLTLQERSSDLYSLLEGLEEMFRPQTEEKGLALAVHRAADAPRYVVTDGGKLRQVLSNLLGNAVKFTQEGRVELRVTAHPGEPGRQVLRFEVEDTGPGIALEELEAVFEPFVQAASGRDPASVQIQEGTGLGLAISRQFARLMGGDINVSSDLGKGSLFQLELQVRLAEEVETIVTQPTRRVLGLAPGQHPADGEAYRVLVAEDRETSRRLMVRLLEPLGFEVREAANGEEAIEIWKAWQPHLIWMDVRMPLMGGREATRRIKAASEGQVPVIIALTATAFEEEREEILLEGCDDFVRKPFRKDEIYDMLAKHLGLRFLYDGERVEPAEARAADRAATAEALPPAALAALPADWVSDLREATIRADLDAILDLAARIRELDAALADALAELAQDFEYKRIQELLERIGG